MKTTKVLAPARARRKVSNTMKPTATERADTILKWRSTETAPFLDVRAKIESAIDQAYRDGEAAGFQRGVEESKKVVECAIEQTVRAFEKASR